MAANPMPEHLSDVHNIALIVRLVVTKDGRLVHGEILDAHEQCRGRFRVWSELAAALQACAKGLSTGETSPPPNSF
jgi:hypothetical protein